MDTIKTIIEIAIRDKSVIRKVHLAGGLSTGSLSRPERLSIRKMMSNYWDNASVFALELGSAVIRQGAFVDKMQSLDWLHSPTARQTMERLLAKYGRFIDIIAKYPLRTAVPTLDVDLGWHSKSNHYYNFNNC